MKSNVAVLIVGATYYGRVVKIFDKSSFITDVKRGYNTVAMNGDVWCGYSLPMDAMVQFDGIEPDPERGEGYFRVTGEVILMEGSNVPATTKETAAVLRVLSAQRTEYHLAHAKNIDPREVQKAAENCPFASLLGPQMINPPDPSEMPKIAADFLHQQFAPLDAIEVSFTINQDEIDLAKEGAGLKEASGDFENQGLAGQAAVLQTEYQNFLKLRRMFVAMNEQGSLKIDSMIPIEHLPDILMTAPVWYIEGKDINDNPGDNIWMDNAKLFFSEMLSSRNAAWLYQIYNARARGFHRFDGRDIMKPRTRKLIAVAREAFDVVVIATPYLDISGEEWKNLKWERSVDPFLFGFSKYLKYAVLVDRWSGTGLLPNLLDMLADTVDHLRINGHLLENFDRRTSWYDGTHGTGSNLSWHNLEPRSHDLGDNEIDKNTVLPKFAADLVKAFDDGKLFEFLRPPKPAAPAPATN